MTPRAGRRAWLVGRSQRRTLAETATSLGRHGTHARIDDMNLTGIQGSTDRGSKRIRGPLKSLYGMSLIAIPTAALGQPVRLHCGKRRTTATAYAVTRSVGTKRHLTCFDLRVQQQAEKLAVGRVSFASGEEITYTNPEEYLKAIREELPYHATSGFAIRRLRMTRRYERWLMMKSINLSARKSQSS